MASLIFECQVDVNYLDTPAKVIVVNHKIVQSAQAQGMQVIIPSKVNRKKQRVLDRNRYKARHLVENLFQRMKVFRRVATRFDKLDVTFLGFVHIAGIIKWLH